MVHLDLKPSNILVDADGGVKLLDFGTSKLVQGNGSITTTLLATPAYASPEQLLNESVTTACDVYSLGVVLYELLAGCRPHSSSSVLFDRAFERREPDSLPSAVTAEAAANRGLSENSLRALLSGDLATIAAKCLRTLPEERYASVDMLAGDLRRYLEGRAVLARPQTFAYTLNRFVKRNRAGVSVVASLALLFLGAVSYAGWRQQQAVLAGQRAMRMQTFLYRLLYLANSNYTGKPTVTVPEFLELGVKLLPDYIKDPADLRAAQMSLAESMYENGDLDNAQKVFAQTTASAIAAGDREAEAESESAAGEIAFLQGQTSLGERLTAHALELSRKPGISPSVRVWSEVYYATNRDRLGFRSDENLHMLEAAVKESRDHRLPPREIADVLYNLAFDLKSRERFDEAEAVYNQALQVYAQDPQAQCDQSAVLGELAFIEDSRGDARASLPLFQRAYEGYNACSGAESRGTLEQRDYLAGALIEVGRAKEAAVLLEGALPAWRKVAASTPDLADPLLLLSKAYVETGRFQEAEKAAAELVAVQEGKVAPTDRRFGASHFVLARALAGEGRYSEALTHAQIADRILTAKAVLSPGAKAMNAQAHAALLDLQSKAGR